MKRPAPLIVIVGETASGKSSLAMDLAIRFNGEIIAADSWTVRRGVDIGTAKPGKDDREKVPHHLLDMVEPCGDYTAAVFKRDAVRAIHDISSRLKLPVMVGGTGLYIDGVIFDFGFLPPSGKSLRQELNEISIEELIARIEAEQISLEGIDTRNKRRLIRLLETGGGRPSSATLRQNTLLIGLRKPREELKARIEARVDKMIESGLEDEVRRLSDRYGWQCEALKGIGYREWKEYFAGSQDLEKTRERIVSSTMGLAKRQRTWFKRNKSIHWVDSSKKAVELVESFLKKSE